MARNIEKEIIWKIRQLFRVLAEKSDTLLKPLGLTAADRAVLEFLYPEKALTVPQIARRLQVSRQHIQVAVNRLKEKGLILTEINPDHARSNLVRLTSDGEALFLALKDLEKEKLGKIFEAVPGAEKIITDRVLGILLENLEP